MYSNTIRLVPSTKKWRNLKMKKALEEAEKKARLRDIENQSC